MVLLVVQKDYLQQTSKTNQIKSNQIKSNQIKSNVKKINKGNTPCTTTTYISSTNLTCIAPEGAGRNLLVTVCFKSTMMCSVDIQAAQLTIGGTPVTINGGNFGSNTMCVTRSVKIGNCTYFIYINNEWTYIVNE